MNWYGFHKFVLKALIIGGILGRSLVGATEATALPAEFGGGLGLIYVKSVAFDMINSRLGNSIRLRQPDKHDFLTTTSGYAAWVSTNQQRSLTLGGWTTAEELQGEAAFAESLTSSSKIQIYGFTATFGKRITPSNHALDTRRKIRREARGLQTWIYGGLGALGFTHDYVQTIPADGNDVQYKINTLSATAEVRFRVAWAFLPYADVIGDLHGMRSLAPITSTQTVTVLMVQGQNQLYRHENLNLETLATSPILAIGLTIGVRMTL